MLALRACCWGGGCGRFVAAGCGGGCTCRSWLSVALLKVIRAVAERFCFRGCASGAVGKHASVAAMAVTTSISRNCRQDVCMVTRSKLCSTPQLGSFPKYESDTYKWRTSFCSESFPWVAKRFSVLCRPSLRWTPP